MFSRVVHRLWVLKQTCGPGDFTLLSCTMNHLHLESVPSPPKEKFGASLVAQLVKNLSAMQETPVLFLCREDSLEKGGIGYPFQYSWASLVAQRVKNQPAMWETWVGKIPWRRAWQPTPLFLPGESPRTGEPGGLQSIGSHRVGHDWATKRSTAGRRSWRSWSESLETFSSLASLLFLKFYEFPDHTSLP